MGEIEHVADTMVDFETQLADIVQAKDLLLLPVVDAFEREHGAIESGRCLGFRTLPVLGGSYDAGNRFPISIEEHCAFSGTVHRQIRDLPDGARVRFEIKP